MSRRHGILGCDRVGQGRENFFSDKGFLGRDRAGHGRACTTGMRATRMCARKRGWRSRSGHAHDKAWACVYNALGVRTKRHWLVHDRDVRATGGNSLS